MYSNLLNNIYFTLVKVVCKTKMHQMMICFRRPKCSIKRNSSTDASLCKQVLQRLGDFLIKIIASFPAFYYYIASPIHIILSPNVPFLSTLHFPWSMFQRFPKSFSPIPLPPQFPLPYLSQLANPAYLLPASFPCLTIFSLPQNGKINSLLSPLFR